MRILGAGRALRLIQDCDVEPHLDQRFERLAQDRILIVGAIV
jgi:hypothetical protein